MVLGVLGCMNSVDFEKLVNEIVLDVVIICQRLQHFQVI
jgi:hypothetical protein